MSSLTVILRTCDRVNAFSGSRPRDFGSKGEVMRKCISSLKKSIDYFRSKGGECKFVVVDDNSSEEMVAFLKGLNPDAFVEPEQSGNGHSFKKCVSLACEEDGLVFLVEDDYLLEEECIESMVLTYLKLKSDFGIEPCFHPTDYPDRYTRIYPSIIALGVDRHYRSIKHTTCTFMYHSSVFQKHRQDLEAFSDYGKVPGITEDNTINKVYNDHICFSPIPSLAEHYQYKETLSPYYHE